MKWLMKLGKNVTVLLVDVGFGVFLMTFFCSSCLVWI